ncbi:hypothetical protein QVN83_02135 [Yersinia frederiksenii]|uniref:hypothetical protein n=1 Tax=Yersinia frederiksenii TaxID=29484 RepID=UPI0025AA6933|nr:hypothetical protein [Yersinia frederiksenii]MDN0117779.1 hypothetical protein [Yersinia frederiksenii]
MRLLLLLTLFLSFIPVSPAAYSPYEYNVWHAHGGILYGTTQTTDKEPVHISIAGPTTNWANMVISLLGHESCNLQKTTTEFSFNSEIYRVEYDCLKMAEHTVISYTLRDAAQVNLLYGQLKSGFTVTLDEHILTFEHPTLVRPTTSPSQQ